MIIHSTSRPWALLASFLLISFAFTGGNDRARAFITNRERLTDPRFHRYFERNEGGPFCTRYIDPKLAYLRESFADFTA